MLEDVRTPGGPEQGLGKAHSQSLNDRPAYNLQPGTYHLPSARPTCRGPDLGTRLCPFPGAAKISRVAKKLSGSAAAGEGREGLQSVLHTMNTATTTCLCQRASVCIRSLPQHTNTAAQHDEQCKHTGGRPPMSWLTLCR